MKRSARSVPTGPGSRGGRWGHNPPAEYWRQWRAAHPEYREREKARRAESRRTAQLEQDRREVDELVARLASGDSSSRYRMAA